MASVIKELQLARSNSVKVDSVVHVHEDSVGLDDRSSVFSKPLIKYGTGRYSDVELIPQPTDDVFDPLNWPLWKKELSFFSLCFTAGSVGVLKSILLTVNAVIVTEFNVSYMGATALTGAPFLIAAISGPMSIAIAQKCGKRPIYLGAIIHMFIGSMWNMHVNRNYAHFMMARALQGLGWGAFEALALFSIEDMYFAHQKTFRITMYNFISLASTWGAPILGGYIAQRPGGWRQQFMLLSIFQSVSIVFAFFSSPETSFKPSARPDPAFKYGSTFTTITAGASSRSKLSTYLHTLSPITYIQPLAKDTFFSPFRHILTPSSLLLSLLTALPTAIAFSTATSLSSLFSPMPTFLLPARIGYLFLTPLIVLTLQPISTILLPKFTPRMAVSLARSSKTKSRRNLFLLAPAMLLALAGTLGFGIYLSIKNIPLQATVVGGIYRAQRETTLNFVVVSVFLGLIVGGAVLGDVSIWGYLATNTAVKLKADGTRGRRDGDDDHVSTWNGISFWKNIVVGIMILALPMGIQGVKALEETFIVLGALEFAVSGGVLALIFWKLTMVERGDRRMLGRKEAVIGRWENEASFFDI